MSVSLARCQGCGVHLLRDVHWQTNVPWVKCGGGIRTNMEGNEDDPLINVLCAVLT